MTGRPTRSSGLLVSSPREQLSNSQYDKEACATFGVLFIRSWHDLTSTVGGFIHDNRDDITVVSTMAVAIFTGTLWWVTWGMVRIAKEQRGDLLRSVEASEIAAREAQALAELARQEFISTHWPLLIIRSIQARIMNSEESMIVRFRMINKGETFATGIE